MPKIIVIAAGPVFTFSLSYAGTLTFKSVVEDLQPIQFDATG